MRAALQWIAAERGTEERLGEEDSALLHSHCWLGPSSKQAQEN